LSEGAKKNNNVAWTVSTIAGVSRHHSGWILRSSSCASALAARSDFGDVLMLADCSDLVLVETAKANAIFQ
jgi:hypothetical protein